MGRERFRRLRPRGEEPGSRQRRAGPGPLQGRFGRPGRGAASRESGAGRRGRGSCQTRLVTGPRRRPPPPGRAAVGQRAGHIPRGAEEMAGIPPAAPPSGLGEGAALARAAPAPSSGHGRGPLPWEGRHHSLRKGTRSAPAETTRPCPVSCPLNLSRAQIVWAGHLGSGSCTPTQSPADQASGPSNRDGAQSVQRARGLAERDAEAPGSEDSASPSLRFWKALATDICKCSRLFKCLLNECMRIG